MCLIEALQTLINSMFSKNDTVSACGSSSCDCACCPKKPFINNDEKEMHTSNEHELSEL